MGARKDSSVVVGGVGMMHEGGARKIITRPQRHVRFEQREARTVDVVVRVQERRAGNE